ncbi:MAG: hypothetical protein M0R32_08245 [Candidatus Cloacimonetes bacterium]|jgi:hypothetical protein|nr:hypothetical protein [Candidatus Cloacimonadota bacterium]
MNKNMSTLPSETFQMLLTYSRFQEESIEDIKAIHNVDLPKSKFPTPDELIKAREDALEFTEEQWKEIQDIIEICADMKAKDLAFEKLDSDRASTDWEGRPYKDYLEMGN